VLLLAPSTMLLFAGVAVAAVAVALEGMRRRRAAG
jgi:hypothetical protein